MSAEGFFHDAHEVYSLFGDERTWVATFATEVLAREYAQAKAATDSRLTLEVVPV